MIVCNEHSAAFYDAQSLHIIAPTTCCSLSVAGDYKICLHCHIRRKIQRERELHLKRQFTSWGLPPRDSVLQVLVRDGELRTGKRGEASQAMQPAKFVQIAR